MGPEGSGGPCVILSDFLRALGQLGDGRFLRVVLTGVALALALLAGVYAGFLALIEMFTPGSVTIPWVGPVGGLHSLLGWGSLALMIVLSVFLMVPVASAFSGLFLESVVDAVEDRHYPALPPATPLPLGESLLDALGFFGVLVGVNLIALAALAFAGPLVPLVLLAVNGALLGREYFTLVAARRLGRVGARQLRVENRGQIWLAGVLMAVPLSVPLVNLVVPVLGVATFTHLFHRLTGSR